MDTKKFQQQLKKYMQGMELDKFKSGLVTWLTHGFHLLILCSGIIFGFMVGLYYTEISTALKLKIENFTKIRSISTTQVLINDKDMLFIIDMNNQRVEIFDDSTTNTIWKMVNEKKASKTVNTK